MATVPRRVHLALLPLRRDLIEAFRQFAFLAVTSVADAKDELRRAELLFHFAVRALGPEVRARLPRGWSCTVGGSFVHGGGNGRYVVTPDVGQPCEIGDLLVAVEFQLGRESARSALLVQAKGPGKPPDAPWTGSDRSGQNQRELFHTRPPFKWTNPAVAFARPGDKRSLVGRLDCPCGTAKWDVREGPDSHWSRWHETDPCRIHGHAVFATLEKDPLVVPPLPGFQPRRLGEVLADLMLFSGGGEFQPLDVAYAPAQLAWSAVVWDILRRSAALDHKSRFGPRWPDRTPVRFRDELDLGDEPGEDNGEALAVVRIVVSGPEDTDETENELSFQEAYDQAVKFPYPPFDRSWPGPEDDEG